MLYQKDSTLLKILRLSWKKFNNKNSLSLSDNTHFEGVSECRFLDWMIATVTKYPLTECVYYIKSL